MAEHRLILKNNQNTIPPVLVSHPKRVAFPKTGTAFPKTGVLFLLWFGLTDCEFNFNGVSDLNAMSGIEFGDLEVKWRKWTTFVNNPFSQESECYLLFLKCLRRRRGRKGREEQVPGVAGRRQARPKVPGTLGEPPTSPREPVTFPGDVIFQQGKHGRCVKSLGAADAGGRFPAQSGRRAQPAPVWELAV